MKTSDAARECKVSRISSRVCERGTKSCEVRHEALGEPEAQTASVESVLQDALLPCPFCGSEADTLDRPASDEGRYISVFCGDVDKCGADIEERLGKGATYSMTDLVRRWNKRAAPSVPSGNEAGAPTGVSLEEAHLIECPSCHNKMHRADKECPNCGATDLGNEASAASKAEDAETALGEPEAKAASVEAQTQKVALAESVWKVIKHEHDHAWCDCEGRIFKFIAGLECVCGDTSSRNCPIHGNSRDAPPVGHGTGVSLPEQSDAP